MLGLAHEIDAGFDRQVFGDMVRTLGRFKDEELAELAVDPAGLREFFSTWLPELS